MRLAPEPGIGPGLALLDARTSTRRGTNRELASTLFVRRRPVGVSDHRSSVRRCGAVTIFTLPATGSPQSPWCSIVARRRRLRMSPRTCRRCWRRTVGQRAAVRDRRQGYAPGGCAIKRRIRRLVAGRLTPTRSRGAVVRDTLNGALLACRQEIRAGRCGQRTVRGAHAAGVVRVVGVQQRSPHGWTRRSRRRAAARRGAGPLARRRPHRGVPAQVGVAGGAEPRPGGGGGNGSVHSD